ncbi:MAG: leucyl/phenylalanyl-tRNA--protein transferase [Bdellovibrionales bacterium RIFOXYD12_FULL_39_22]|nr:MAG: leucyl/phenylalanyl-tRNA--protein transferase [Bdellovibrionales bacterium RIFOXYB1_FULL_39_21]OFZ41184.1 MAG: leucyl/phenylalanyl-tRNA--protein transferase [Bdellovibrionales bacterium RIFOXYC12_FULL_39_17]OFZ44938.1 MAG: leucyl/phenylalanyl-tRNA--protein transferase [Bdellovibrionales bacterium RIFOXYC1_FULL_39_130]OFZ72075.1 MAG: leucyl/phenylalanyl-tRNA--protein transferase [Bdellovibrionales bacterium RIFOXYC2_FULL_39_8]OFZ74385.1 MAG: leucyl/phenylalanyl-tRNA--protein transferase 
MNFPLGHSIFPSLESASTDGIIAVGGDLEIATLYDAYTHGIFPWPISHEYPLAWFAPDPRGILQYQNLHISKSMQKFINKNLYEVRMNYNFQETITACAKANNRKGQKGTWITPEIIEGYCKLHQAGYAYSVEVYDNELLVGGLYGVCISRYISGESMFYLRPNCSKLALFYLMNYLQEKMINWIDTQMITPVVRSMGGEEISRSDFMAMLKKSLTHQS